MQISSQFLNSVLDQKSIKSSEYPYQSPCKTKVTAVQFSQKTILAQQCIKIPNSQKKELFSDNLSKSNLEYKSTYQSFQFTNQQQKYFFKILQICQIINITYIGFILPILTTIKYSYLITNLFFDLLSFCYIVFKFKFQKDRKKFFKYYFTSIDGLEIIALIPFEILQLKYNRNLYVLKILRIVSFDTDFRATLLKYISFKSIEFWKMFLSLQFIIIWISNLWISYSSSFHNENNWVQIYCNDDQSKCFLKAYYFILYTLMTIGYGQITPNLVKQRAVLIIIMLFGVFILSYCLTKFSIYITQVFLENNNKETQCLLLEQIQRKLMSEGSIDLEWQKKQKLIKNLKKYIYRQHDTGHQYQNNHKLINQFPTYLQNEINNTLKQYLLKDIKFFKKFQFNFLEILSHIKQFIYLKGQFITIQGQISENMYFINKGSAGAILSNRFQLKQEIVFAVFLEKSSFGQYQVLPNLTKTMFSIKALQFSKILSISGYDLLPYLEANHKQYQKLMQYIKAKKKILKKYHKLKKTKILKILSNKKSASKYDFNDNIVIRSNQFDYSQEQYNKQNIKASMHAINQFIVKFDNQIHPQ